MKPTISPIPIKTFSFRPRQDGEMIRPVKFTGVMLDTETTGLWDSKHALTDIGLVPFFVDMSTLTYGLAQGASVAIRPFKGSLIDDKALEHRQVTREWLFSRPGLLSERDALDWTHDQLKSLLGDPIPDAEGSDIRTNWFGRVWAQNGVFDYGFLRSAEKRILHDLKLAKAQELAKASRSPDSGTDEAGEALLPDLSTITLDWKPYFYGRPWFSDTRNQWINMAGMGLHDLPHASLGTVADYLGIDRIKAEAHQALPDCQVTIHMLAREVERMFRWSPE